MTIVKRYEPTLEPDAHRLARARIGVLALFFLGGLLLASFLSRLPSVRDAFGLSEAGLARLLLVGAVGALTALMITGWAAVRWGTRRLLIWSTFGYTGALALAGVAVAEQQMWLFATAQFAMTFSFAFTNVPMNAEAASVERHVGHSIMPRFHAAFSIGMALGLALAALISHLGVSPTAHWIGVGIAAMVLRLLAIGPAVVDGRPQPRTDVRPAGPFAVAKQEYRERQVLLLGVIVFAAAMTEMSAGQWIAISVVDDFGKTEAIGDLSYWIFVVAMVSIRWLGTPLIDRWGRVVVLRASAVSAITGLLIYALAPSHYWALPGLVLWGFGAALTIPIGFSAASDLHARATARVAAVSSFATVAQLFGPQLVGGLADAFTTRVALLVIVVALVASFAVAPAARKRDA